MAHEIAKDVYFNHIGKCGGTWVFTACAKAGCYLGVRGNGRTPSHTLRWAPKTFTFVRHPFDWYGSWHNHKERWGLTDKFPDTVWTPDLNETVRAICFERPGFLTEMYQRYTVCPEGVVGYIGKQEYLEDHLTAILQKFEVQFCEISLRETKRKNSGSLSQSLSGESILLIHQTERLIFEKLYRTDGIIEMHTDPW